jgi:cysteinyl-tRNA synthetase
MEDDFNTADALARVEHLYARLNARIDAKALPAEVGALLRTARELSHVLGLSLRAPEEAVRSRRQLAARRKDIDPAWVEERIAARVAARKSKDFAQADAIRAEVGQRGVELRDSPTGTDWRVLL